MDCSWLCHYNPRYYYPARQPCIIYKHPGVRLCVRACVCTVTEKLLIRKWRDLVTISVVVNPRSGWMLVIYDLNLWAWELFLYLFGYKNWLYWCNLVGICVMLPPRNDKILVTFELDHWPWKLHHCNLSLDAEIDGSVQRFCSPKTHGFIGLFRPPGPASAGRGGLYILLLHFIYFFCHSNLQTRIGPSAARRYYKSRLAAGDAHKISTDIRPLVPPFFTNALVGAAKISTPIVFGPPYFWRAALYRKTKTNLSRIDDRSTIVPNSGSVGPPNSENRWRNGYPKP